MPADEKSLLRLLDLQEEDSAIKRLHERKASLPEAQRLQEVRAKLEELRSDVAIAQKQDHEAQREQKRLEDEIEVIDQKVAKEEQRMFSGNVSNPKELSSLQAEVASLKKRKGSFEDELIEAMDQREQTSDTLNRLEQEQEQTATEESSLAKTVEGLTSDIDAELATHDTQRAEVAAEIPDDLLTLYDKLRAQKGGVGAARLERDTCSGCHTRLPSKEVERLRAEGGLQRCDNCRRILVIT